MIEAANLISADVVDDAGERGVAPNHHGHIIDWLEEDGRLALRTFNP